MISLKIRQDRPSPLSTRVWLDGHEISRGLTSLTLTLGAGDVTRAELSIFVDDVDVDAETLAHLRAYVRPQEATG